MVNEQFTNRINLGDSDANMFTDQAENDVRRLIEQQRKPPGIAKR